MPLGDAGQQVNAPGNHVFPAFIAEKAAIPQEERPPGLSYDNNWENIVFSLTR